MNHNNRTGGRMNEKPGVSDQMVVTLIGVVYGFVIGLSVGFFIWGV